MTKSSLALPHGGQPRGKRERSRHDWLKGGFLSAAVTLSVAWYVAPSRAAQQTHLDNMLRARSAAVLTYERRDRDLQQAEAKVAADLATRRPDSTALGLDQAHLIDANSALTQARIQVSNSGTPALDALTQRLWADHGDVITFLERASGASSSSAEAASPAQFAVLQSRITSDFVEFVTEARKSL